MFILKPTQPKVFTKDDIGTIEEVVRDSRLVDKGIRELKKFSPNAPSFDPERRKFFKHAAVLAGLIASGKFLEACSPAVVEYQGKSYGSWEAWLMSQDWIRGPSLLRHPSTGLPSDFKHHLRQPVNAGLGAVDYSVEIGTPITPTVDSYSSFPTQGREAGKVLYLLHRGPYHRTSYAHLDKFADFVYEGKPVSRGGRSFIDNEISKLKVVAYSGATGIGPGGGGQPPHLHFGIYSTTNNQIYSLDPFTLGIDAEKPYGGVDQGIPLGGRPVYWDAKTEIPHRAKDKKVYLQKSLDTLVQRVQQSNLDQATKKEILDRQNKPEELRDYLGMRVLQKKPGAEGKPQYEFMPGSLMYALMLEFYVRTSKEGFIAMLPFIYPPLKPYYQKANPGVKF